MKRGQRSRENEAVPAEYLDKRPIIIAVAGPNGAGKSTFFQAYLKKTGLRFLNADAIARELEVGAYEAASLIAVLRTELVNQRESFIFETVFSDPQRDKLDFLKGAASSGYAVVLCFIGIADAGTSEQRVAMRIFQGGHDVPAEKLVARFPRTMRNLALAMRELPCVVIFDNEDLHAPFRHVATYLNGRQERVNVPVPLWLKALL